MKRNLLLPVLLLFVIFSVKAQEKRINLYGGYTFDDSFESYYDAYNYYDGKIKGGFQYGAGLEFLSHPDFGVELLYIGQKSKVPLYYYDVSDKNTVYDLNLNYALLAFNKHFQKEGSKFEISGGIMLGALFADAKNPESGDSRSVTKFSWGLRIGGDYWVSDKIGIKIQSLLLSSIQAAGSELFFGNGGAGYGTTTSSAMMQLSFSGGLVFRFGNGE